ncbi:hypothetical protein NQ314_021370 [Rhamnusium bicolor]|uniref:Retrotransposon gag domain-containing protein n=1 Tax=Rhamnusium bicolor TaxID=1586634 RepID=A0AAV8WHM5_9CUCU|nr:hypothetical protein NQ314_021370 [Rhamnusium bicolor]
MYELIRSLISPETIDKKTYKDITKVLTSYFAPKTSVIVCRFKFYRRDQLPNEGITVYIAELRHLAETCNFGSVLEDKLRDRLVCGVIEEALQRRLLTEPELTFDKAQKQAIAYETAVKHTSMLRECTGTQSTSAQVHKVNNSSQSFPKKNNRNKKKVFPL